MVQTGVEKKNSPKVTKGTKVLKVVAKCGLVNGNKWSVNAVEQQNIVLRAKVVIERRLEHKSHT
jgi:hypothetical protein